MTLLDIPTTSNDDAPPPRPPRPGRELLGTVIVVALIVLAVVSLAHFGSKAVYIAFGLAVAATICFQVRDLLAPHLKAASARMRPTPVAPPIGPFRTSIGIVLTVLAAAAVAFIGGGGSKKDLYGVLALVVLGTGMWLLWPAARLLFDTPPTVYDPASADGDDASGDPGEVAGAGWVLTGDLPVADDQGESLSKKAKEREWEQAGLGKGMISIRRTGRLGRAVGMFLVAFGTAMISFLAATAGSKALLVMVGLVIVVGCLMRARDKSLFALFGTVCAMAFLVHKSFGPLDLTDAGGAPSVYITSLDAMIVVLYGLWVAEGTFRADVRSAVRTKILWVPLIGAAAMLPSMLAGTSSGWHALAELVKMAWMQLLFFYVAVRVRSKAMVWAVLGGLAAFAVVELIVILLQWKTGGVLGLSFLGVPTHLSKRITDASAIGRPFGTLIHPDFMGAAMGSIGLLAFALGMTLRRSLTKVIALVLSCASVLCLWLAHTRASFVALVMVVFAMTAVAILHRHLQWRTIGRFILVLLIGSAVFFPQLEAKFHQNFGTGHFGEEVTSRFQLNDVAGQMFYGHPVIGVGLNSFQIAMGPYEDHGVIFISNPVQNLYLLYLSETGIIGMAGLLFVGIAMFNIAVRLARSRDRLFGGIGLGISGAMAFLMIEELLGFSLRQDIPLAVYWVFAGLAVASYRMAGLEGVRRRAALGSGLRPPTDGLDLRPRSVSPHRNSGREWCTPVPRRGSPQRNAADHRAIVVGRRRIGLLATLAERCRAGLLATLAERCRAGLLATLAERCRARVSATANPWLARRRAGWRAVAVVAVEWGRALRTAVIAGARALAEGARNVAASLAAVGVLVVPTLRGRAGQTGCDLASAGRSASARRTRTTLARAGLALVALLALVGFGRQSLAGAGATPTFVPVSQMKIVFAARDNKAPYEQGIYEVNGDGTGFHPILVSHTSTMYNWPQWALNGTKIVFTIRSGPPLSTSDPLPSYENILEMNPDGSDLRQLTNYKFRTVHPKMSADGTSVIFTGENPQFPDHAIYKLNLVTLQATNLSQVTKPGGAADADPKWTEDGRIVTATTESSQSGNNIEEMNADGTDRQTLVADGNYNTDPEISPDGTELAYSAFDGPNPVETGSAVNPNAPDDAPLNPQGWFITVKNLSTGTTTQLNQGNACLDQKASCGPNQSSGWKPVWSPDGKTIAWTGRINPTTTCICAENVDGTDSRVLVQSSNFTITWFDWTQPGGVAPPSAVPDSEIGSQQPTSHLLISANLGAGNQPAILDEPPDMMGDGDAGSAGMTSPSGGSWSSDRSEFVFVASTPYNADDPQYGPAPPPGQSVHGHFTLQELDPAHWFQPPADIPATEQVFLHKADGTNEQLTTPWTEDWRDAINPGDARSNTDPVLSPDGSSVVFTNHSSLTGESFLLSLDLKTGAVLNLTNATAGALQVNDGLPAWSPDGTKIAFTWTEGAYTNVYVMNATTGTTVTPVSTDNGYDMDPTWSPDGASIVFSHYDGTLTPTPEELESLTSLPRSGWSLIKIDVATGRQTVLTTPADSPTWRPVFSPDGTAIDFIGWQYRTTDIFQVGADGGPVSPLLITPNQNETSVSWK